MPSSPEQKRSYAKERYRQRRATAITQLGGKCVVCGTTADLEFDHIKRETKEFNVGRLFSYSEQRFQAELQKCQLLCKTHHKEKTLSEMTGPREHGTHAAYRKGKCRCVECREFFSKYRAEWRRRTGRVTGARRTKRSGEGEKG